MTWYLDAFFDRREGGIEIVGAHKWVMPCNWKFPAENFGGDLYHVEWSHLSSMETGFSPSGTRKLILDQNVLLAKNVSIFF